MVGSVELLPCPHCGGAAELWRATNGRAAFVGCMGRCSVLVSGEHATDAEAITAWNRRSPLPPQSPGGDVSEGALKKAEAEFTEYFVRNYPGPDTIIGKPEWHAPKIFRAALHSLRAYLAAVTPSGWVLVPEEPTMEMSLAGRKVMADIADRMEAAKMTAVSVIDFWQQVGHRPADEIFAAMLSACPAVPAIKEPSDGN